MEPTAYSVHSCLAPAAGSGSCPALAVRKAVRKKESDVASKPIPKPSFLDDCDYLGAFSGERRWRSKDGKRIFTWDGLHGHLIKPAVKGRRIDV
jgi:hypothetical protein